MISFMAWTRRCFMALVLSGSFQKLAITSPLSRASRLAHSHLHGTNLLVIDLVWSPAILLLNLGEPLTPITLRYLNLSVGEGGLPFVLARAQEYLVRARPILHSFHALGIALYRLALGTHCWRSAQYCDRQDYSKCRHSIPLMHQIQSTNFSISLAQRPGYCGQVVARVERSIAIPRKSCRSE